METQHTSGEWHAKDGQIYETEKGRTLALVPYFDSNCEEDKANQNLIAAAPDLLKALVELLKEARQNSFNLNHNLEDTEAERNEQAEIQKAINP